MVVERKISKQTYVFAAIFTVLIFSLGVSLGIIFDYQRLNWINQLTKEYDVDFRSLQFQSLYLSNLERDNASCSVLSASLEDAVADLGYSLDRVLEYEKQSKIGGNGFDLIKRRYLLDNLRYWLFAREAKKLCDFDVVNILYFHSIDDCDTCPNQGVLLTYFKKIFGDRLLVFPINIDIEDEEPSIRMVKKRYDIEELPTIIIEDKKYEGIVERNELGRLICKGFKTKQKGCE